jgi:hypothetical protein
LDESGDPFGWKQQRNFVLGGIAVHETQIYRLSNKLDQLQKEYFPDRQIPVEFHVTQIRNRKDEYSSFSEDEREEIISKVYSILAKQRFPRVILFATSLDVSALPNRAAATQINFENICKNFNLNLYHSMLHAKKTGKPFSKGLVIIDRGREKRYLQLFDEFRRSEEVEGYLANVVDIPYFGACSDTRMLQYADFVSNAVWRYYEYGDSEHIDQIKHLFYCGSENWPVSGLNHITKHDCDCYSCSFKDANEIK